MEKKKSTFLGKISVLGLLTTIVFLILKLTEAVDWNWVWVFLPILIALGLNLLMGLIKDAMEYFRK